LVRLVCCAVTEMKSSSDNTVRIGRQFIDLFEVKKQLLMLRKIY